MDIATRAEIVLRGADYETWTWTGGSRAVTCFENATVIGFIHVFESVEELLTGWENSQKSVLARHATSLRAANTKAWNVYSVFLTEEEAPSRHLSIARIEEDFALTRKIARAGIQTSSDIESVLLPLILIKSKPLLTNEDFKARLRSSLKEFPVDAVEAFLGVTSAREVVQILEDKS